MIYFPTLIFVLKDIDSLAEIIFIMVTWSLTFSLCFWDSEVVGFDQC